ncbi:MAG: hypothetical protein PUB42_03740 [Firmicutes bacterium]|nr:hypothetical protein [Bacillota bacterium]
MPLLAYFLSSSGKISAECSNIRGLKNYNDITKGSVLKNLIYFVLSCRPFSYKSHACVLLPVDLLTGGYFGVRTDVSSVNVGKKNIELVTHFVSGIYMGATVMLVHHAGAQRDDDKN